MKNLIIHTPEGFRDIYGQEMKRKRTLMRGFEDVFDHYGYEPIETPTVEYFDVFSNEVGTTPSNELYKFFDRDGNTMVLRPAFTPSVCRAVAMHFPKEGMPYRLSYEGSTFVNSQEYQLNLKQATQAGVELIGDGSAKADAEILMLTCDLLKKAGIREFQVSVGEVDFFKSLAAESGLDEETIEQVRSMISNKNFFGVSERLGSADINPVIRRAFAELPKMFGGAEVLDEAETFAVTEKSREAIARLREIWSYIEGTDNERYISWDFGLLSKYHYYTGIIFSAFTYGTGEPVAKGGRYDRMLAHFGEDAPAVGVGLYVDQLMMATRRD